MRNLTALLAMTTILNPLLLVADEPPAVGTQVSAEQSPELELRVSGSNVVFEGERDLSKAISEAAKLKRKVKQAATPLRQIQQEINKYEIGLVQGEQQLVLLNTQLANVQDVATNNRLVGTLNAIEGQMTLGRKTLEIL